MHTLYRETKPMTGLPTTIRDTPHLEELLSEPTEGVIEALGSLKGDIIVLGAAGKMGPTLSRMARRASDAAGSRRRVIAVSRFSQPGSEQSFTSHGVETIRCDLLEPEQLAALPDAPNVVYMAGMKFGSTGSESLTWAMNTFLPGQVALKYCHSRIAAFSTGNIYGLTPAARGGSVETDDPNPQGEYAMSCLGRERILEHFSRTLQIPMSVLRLNYAVETRYGVLVDLARKVWRGDPIDVSMGYVNVIWQGDASAMALQSLARASSPPLVVNIAGPDLLSVREVCREYGRIWGREPVCTGTEADDALLSDGERGRRLFGPLRVSVEQMRHWIADWVARGGETLEKPTHFESRDGRF